jgi:abequosyltransferase
VPFIHGPAPYFHLAWAGPVCEILADVETVYSAPAGGADTSPLHRSGQLPERVQGRTEKPVIRLSICITTLNRGDLIGETLQSILSQVTEEVEVLVLDAASKDNTPEVVRGFAARYPQLRYTRLEQSLDFDEKCHRLVEMAQGEYCWLFADDDLLKPGTVAAVLEATRHDYGLIIVNAEVRTKDFAERIEAKVIHAEADRVYSPKAPDCDELLATTGMYLSFMGAALMKRQAWLKRHADNYYGLGFIHTQVLVRSRPPGDTLVMAHPWITIRFGNGSWLTQSFEIWMFHWPRAIWQSPDFADWAKARVTPREPWRSYVRLLFYRAMGRYSRAEYETCLASRIKSPLRQLLSRAIATAPIGPLNWLARFYVRHVLRKVPSIALFELEVWRPATRFAAGAQSPANP